MIEHIVFDINLVFVESVWLAIQQTSCPTETIPLMRNYYVQCAYLGEKCGYNLFV